MEGESLRAICRDAEMPGITTAIRWLSENEQFRAHYTHAKEVQAEIMAEEIMEIADAAEDDVSAVGSVNHEHIQRSRLRVDTRKWVMSKLLPKKYGDRQHIEHGGSIRRDPDSYSDAELARIAAGGGGEASGPEEGA